MNSNQPIRSPFGDIATFNSPALDRMGAIWYQEEKERKNKALAAEKAEKDDYTEKLTNIRAADVDEYKDFHNKWATARKEAIQLSKKGNPADYQKKIEESNILFAKLNRLVNASLEEKKNPNRQVSIKDRSDDYDEIDAVYKITPTSQLNKTYKTKSGREIVLADVEPLIYRPNQMDYTALGKAGLGTPKKGSLKYVDLGNGERKKVVPEYFNNPVAIADAVANEMNKVRNGVREVETNLGFLEAQQPKIEAEFDAYINSPEYKEIYGTNAPTFTQPRTRAEKLTQLFAKDLFLKNKPRFIDGEQETTPQEKLRVEAARDKRELGQQIDAEKRAEARAIAKEQREEARKKQKEKFTTGMSVKQIEDLDIRERFAKLLSGEPSEVDLNASADYVENGVTYKNLTPVFKSMDYQRDKDNLEKGETKTFEKVLFNPITKEVVVSYKSPEDKNSLMKGTRLQGGKELSNTKTFTLSGGSKKAKIQMISHIANGAGLTEPAIDYLQKIIYSSPHIAKFEQEEKEKQSKNAQQQKAKAAQQPKAKEAPKAKQVSKQSKKPKAELDDL